MNLRKIFSRQQKMDNSKPQPAESNNTAVSILSKPKLSPLPKILLIDIKDDSQSVLHAKGYNVAQGSFGTPYRVEKSDLCNPVIFSAHLPNCSEQEILVIDLVPNKTLDASKGEKHTSDGEDDWWVSCSQGVIDPRPRAMAVFKSDFDRIISHGGIFLVFADGRNEQKTFYGHLQRHYGLNAQEIFRDNWGFLSVFENTYRFTVKHDIGEQIIGLGRDDALLSRLITEHLDDAFFLCTFEYHGEDIWIPLAENKFNAEVAGALCIKNEEDRPPGWVFVFPQIKNKSEFLSSLLQSVLPDISPHLFPFVEGSRWVTRTEYELPRVLELKQEIQKVEEEATHRKAALDVQIKSERIEYGYLHDLLRETGDALVVAVEKTLDKLGFQEVINADEKMAAMGEAGQRREDLQIHDNSPILLVEIKGKGGLPKEVDSLQVWKYMAPRMKEWDRTDVQGLSIINHQRHIPAIDRENLMPFSEDILTNAREHNFGLMTTWDLYRLARGHIKNDWKYENIKSLFYDSGRIDPIPSNYQYVGRVERFWEGPSAVAVNLEGEINKGDRIAFELQVDFEEQRIQSLMLDDVLVEKSESGNLIGIQTKLSKEQARKGVRVFRVS